jgi:calcium-dependent protein kinase
MLYLMQGGRIDYNEFASMMQKGNLPMVGKKGLENNFSIRFKEALKL